jgi:hypothetical protein
MGVEAGMERRKGHPGHSLEYFEMRRTRTINAPDACQVAPSWSSYERARARNARGRRVLNGTDTNTITCFSIEIQIELS